MDIATVLEPPLQESLPGKILCCFDGQKREDILKFEYMWSKMDILKRFISLIDELEKRYGIDYIIFDTSPGNIGLARILLRTSHSGIFTIRTGEIDNERMGNVINYIQAVNAECKKEYKRNVYHEVESGTLSSITDDLIRTLKPQYHSSVIKFIRCYCDIRFAQREFLTVLGYPEHAFTQKISELIELIDA